MQDKPRPAALQIQARPEQGRSGCNERSRQEKTPVAKELPMQVHTSRFGPMEVDDTRVIQFPRGILGFPRFKNYVLIQPEPDSTFYWLQSVEAADLAFVVTDPLLFVPDYTVPLREETRTDLGLNDLSEANVLVIVNKVADTLTANLQGPLVIHSATRVAAQIVISEKKYQTRHPIVHLQRAGKTAAQNAAAAPAAAGAYVSKSA
jgi:flagellar assembly factor FliW